MRALTVILALGLFAVSTTFANAACSKPKYKAAHLKTIPTKAINQSLFAEALSMEASYVRCKQGRGVLTETAQVSKSAAKHSARMARAKKLSHQGFKPRMRATGIKFKTAAENVAAFDRYQFPVGNFQVRNAAACIFATQSGAAIPAHTYASLARTVVAGWMRSSGHKKNLLNRRMKMSGGGVGFDASAPNCGRFYITQNYLG